MLEEKNDAVRAKAPFVPLYREIILWTAARGGVGALGCLCVLAYATNKAKGWKVNAGLRELAGQCGVSVNTLRNSLLPALARAGIISIEGEERAQSVITLQAFLDAEAGKPLADAVSNFDTAQKNFASKKQTVSNFDTETGGLAALFPEFVVHAGAKTGKTGLKNGADEAQSGKSVSKIDTAHTVSNFDTVSPLHTSPREVIFINKLNNNKSQNPPAEKQNKPVSLEEVKAYFAQKGYATDPEEFFCKNEARGWTWTDRAGKNHKIKNWKACAFEFEKKTKARGKVNWNAPQKDEERLFAWYYQTLLPEAFANEAARENRWAREKGDFAFIASVGGGFERGRQIIIRGAESLEKGGFAASVKAIANGAMRFNEELNLSGKRN